MSDNAKKEEQQQQTKEMKRSLGSLQIRRATAGNGAQIVNRSGEWQPIQIPFPNTVIGFAEISISFIDQTVIEFLQRIRRLFDSNGTILCIGTAAINQNHSWEIIWQQIWPLFNSRRFGGRALQKEEMVVGFIYADDPSASTSKGGNGRWVGWKFIWPLVNGNIYNFRLNFSDHDRLQQLSSAILCNCANLELIGAYRPPLNFRPKTTPVLLRWPN
uniref:Methyltransferase type 11 domain-containing protein n=1 Tax=Globodera rostochiensis TaxID=31243 RepID=A0A914IGX1_GLORO